MKLIPILTKKLKIILTLTISPNKTLLIKKLLTHKKSGIDTFILEKKLNKVLPVLIKN
jgi:hypothetical protein